MTLFVYILLCLIWGSTWSAIKIGLVDMPPLYSSAFRFITAVIVLSGLAFIRGDQFPRPIGKIIRIGYPGIYMFGMSYALVYFAQGWISSGLASLLFAAFPFFVGLLSKWLLPDEQLSGRGWIGLVIGFAGIVIISLDSLSLSGNLFLGTILGASAPLVSAYGMLLYKRQFGNEKLLPTLSIQMTAGGVPLLAMAVLFEDLSAFQVTWPAVGSILYLAIAGTVVTFLGYFWLLRRIRVAHASLIAFVTPLVAILIGVVLFSEPLRPAVLAGGSMILVSVLMVRRR